MTTDSRDTIDNTSFAQIMSHDGRAKKDKAGDATQTRHFAFSVIPSIALLRNNGHEHDSLPHRHQPLSQVLKEGSAWNATESFRDCGASPDAR